MKVYKLTMDLGGTIGEFYFFEERTAIATAEFFKGATVQDIEKNITIEVIEIMSHQRALDDLLQCLDPNNNPNLN